MVDTTYSGTWHCSYWYPSNQQDGEDISEYDMTAEQTGNQLVLQSVPNADGSYLLARLLVDDVFAAGSWTENTAPRGEFGGMIYSGVMQLLINENGSLMNGQWVGVGRNIPQQVPGVFGGRFETNDLKRTHRGGYNGKKRIFRHMAQHPLVSQCG